MTAGGFEAPDLSQKTTENVTECNHGTTPFDDFRLYFDLRPDI